MARYSSGLSPESLDRRARREEAVAGALGGSREDFEDWRWQVRHVLADATTLSRAMRLLPEEREAIEPLADYRIPFGVTPYYASLMDDDPEAGRDRALRAQVLPPKDYVDEMIARRGQRHCAFDFMLERNTSPTDLVTQRYPAIAILKPFNTCPQICVYCQRNWEIDQPMAPGALASPQVLDEAIGWIREHPSIREVLVTGGDPLGLPDGPLMEILGKVAAIPHVDLIRIGTRTPVTLPMRITEALAAGLGSLREPGRREVCVVTHVQHPYEVTPRMVRAVDRLRRQGIPVFNQMVFTLFVSRRFEASALRMLLRRIGIEPYYTFLPKGKEELADYRVPIARLMQEQAEEARLLPGSRRTDEAVYNVPSLGKNYLRAMQHRDLLSILPDGSRVYSFHPWEMGIAPSEPYIGRDVPLLDYLERLRGIGEDPGDYESLWYYY
jgi:lysine 2,3-aminomutase